MSSVVVVQLKGKPRCIPPNVTRKQYRVQNLRDAFQSLQSVLPTIPPSTKLSRLDVLQMAAAYIAHLGRQLVDENQEDCSTTTPSSLPIKKWPMRVRLFTETYSYPNANYSSNCIKEVKTTNSFH